MSRRVALWIAEGFVLIALFAILWLNGYGPCWSPDDALHLAQPLRYLQGDLPFVHEWHPSFMFGVLAMPVVKMALWMSGDGTSDGFMLCTRHFASVIWFLGVILCWWRWRGLSRIGAFVGLLLFAVWPPWGKCTIAYNDWGVLFLMVGVSFYATNSDNRLVNYFFAGFFYALSVLCCPHLIILYVIFSACLLWRNRRSWLWGTLGVACPASIVTAWVLSHVSAPRIVEMLPYVMNDPEHPARSLVGLLCESVGRFLFITHDFAWGHAVIVAGYFVIAGLMLLDRGKMTRIAVYGGGLLVLATLHLGYYVCQPMVSMNVQFVPLVLMSGCFVLLTKDELARRAFIMGWIPAAIYGACVGASSNLGIYSIGFAFEAAMIPSAIILLVQAKANRPLRVLIVGFMAFHAFVLYCPTCRYLAHWNSMRRNICLEGVMKGIAKGGEKEYEQLLADTHEMRTSEKVKTVVYLDHPSQWLYLASDKRNGSFSSWTCGVNEAAVNRLEEYWKLNPEKFPDAIFVAAQYRDVAQQLATRHALDIETKQTGNVLWKGGVR